MERICSYFKSRPQFWQGFVLKKNNQEVMEFVPYCEKMVRKHEMYPVTVKEYYLKREKNSFLYELIQKRFT